MFTLDDRIADLLQRRRSIRFRELQKVLLDLGFAMRQQRRGGSHYVFKHPAANDLLVLVSHGTNDLLPEYQVMKAAKVLRILKEKT
ncbi:MAG: type II toxin-antitoxin system HicA family toxin [Ignavibacteriae bacterium]|nr:type II toxin-antitoxin system HicA family toxin [Ignavibacteriota bacterium]